jgi:hypothetical protein
VVTDRELLEVVVAHDPWMHTAEGLEDCCLFCESRQYDRGRWFHWPTCAWLTAARAVGAILPGHFMRAFPANPYRDSCELCRGEPTVTLAEHRYHVSDEYRVAQAEFDALVAEVGIHEAFARRAGAGARRGRR